MNWSAQKGYIYLSSNGHVPFSKLPVQIYYPTQKAVTDLSVISNVSTSAENNCMK